jgi:dihydroceramidase
MEASQLVAFALWNVDNLLCSHLTFLKSTLGSPSAWLFEAHAYWHLLTGVGVYAIVVYVSSTSFTPQLTRLG